MVKEVLIRRLIEVGALKFGEFILSSGQKSNIYVDIKHACTFPDILNLIVKLMSEKLRNLEFDKIACIELGGVPIAVALSLEINKPYVIFRKIKKDYGMEEDCIGVIKRNERFIVVEDVTTTGSSALSVVERVEKKGGKVVKILCVVDRGAKIDKLDSILSLSELLNHYKYSIKNTNNYIKN